MGKLGEQKCIPCRGGIPPLDDEEIATFQADAPEWQVTEVEGIKRLKRSFRFKNFAAALSFVNEVGRLAEVQDHHPKIVLEWGKVVVFWWTHKIRGLHKNDFIMAAKVDEIEREPLPMPKSESKEEK